MESCYHQPGRANTFYVLCSNGCIERLVDKSVDHNIINILMDVFGYNKMTHKKAFTKTTPRVIMSLVDMSCEAVGQTLDKNNRNIWPSNYTCFIANRRLCNGNINISKVFYHFFNKTCCNFTSSIQSVCVHVYIYIYIYIYIYHFTNIIYSFLFSRSNYSLSLGRLMVWTWFQR